MFYHTSSCALLLLVVIFPRASTRVITFDKLAYFNVKEDTNIDDKIGHFTVKSGDDLKIVSKTDYVDITYSKQSGDEFLVDVYLKTKLDADHGSKFYTLFFEASAGKGSSETKKIKLIVDDVNDEVPEWVDRPYSVVVKEDAEVDSMVYSKIKASDPDRNDFQTYTLLDDKNSPFSLDSNDGNLMLAAPLDFETRTFYQYTVAVTDGANHSATADVFITVEDIQDTPPKFYKDSYSFTILENAKKDTQLKPAVQAIDGDLGVPNEITLSIFNETCPGLLRIDETSGTLTVWNPPDRDNGTILDNDGLCIFFIKASEVDKVSSSRALDFSFVSVEVTVTDENDNEPLFSQSIYNASIDENAQTGVAISILGDAVTIQDQDQGNNAKFTVKITSPLDVFEVTPSVVQGSAEILIKVLNSTVIDFEKNKFLLIELEAKDEGNDMHTSAQVHLTINNMNDHSPIFDVQRYEASIPECSKFGTEVLSIHATDKDASDPENAFNEVTYSFDKQNKFFTIDEKSGVVKVASEELNREEQDLFYITVIAEDGGGYKESSVWTIRISDVNDNDPVFSSSQYETSVQEGHTTMRTPVQVKATDADEAKNAEIVYSLFSTSPDNLQDYFSINEENGSLSILKPIAYEDIFFPEDQEGKIILTVYATDKGDVPRNTSVSVIVRLEDLNNKSPRCASGSYNVTVNENLKDFQFITINATDDDGTAPNNCFMFSIDGANSDFTIDSISGAIATRAGLDFENSKFHNIEVTVTDLGYPPQSSTCEVNVTVLDVNDVPPEFPDKKETIEEYEGSKFSFSCTAKDPDFNHELLFSIDWSHSEMHRNSKQTVPVDTSIQDLVKIDGKTCKVDVPSLDRENITELNLFLQVHDENAEGDAPQKDEANFIIIVKDKNDEEPVFANGPDYTASIRENMPVDSIIKLDKVAGITVIDKDADESHSKFELRLLTFNNTFKIEPSSGTFTQTFNIEVRDSTKLDFETKESFELQIEVTQIDTEQSFRNLATVKLRVENENDNFPSFERSSYEASIPEKSPSNTAIMLLQAQDGDSGDYGVLRYSFKEENKMFAINETTGQVTLVSSKLDFETGPITYNLAVMAIDGGNFTTSTQLVISIQDSNDNPPEFLSSIEREIHIKENEKYFYPSLIVQARDKDSPGSNNSKIVYSLRLADDIRMNEIDMNEDTGEITLSMPFDFEALDTNARERILMEVTATDMGTPAFSTTFNLSLIVADVNDQSPEFDKTSYNISIPESTDKGTSLLTVQAKDKDVSDKYNQVTYSLDSASLATFEIDPQMGTLRTKETLDKETVDSYDILVSATDNGTPSRMNTTTVTINITDVNDTPPHFSWETNSLEVNEGYGTQLVANSATDEDLDSLLEYSIEWEDSSGVNGYGNYMKGTELKPFIKINESTGEVSPVNPLDREKVQQFQLTLAVNDKHAIPGKEQKDTALLKIVVKDKNDNRPEFEGPNHIKATVKETAQVGTPITFLNRSALVFNDADGEGNNVYDITIEGDDFYVKPTQGHGKTSCSIYVGNGEILDYEENQNLTLVVTASDSANQSSTITITLLIENENDNIPKFDSTHYTEHILENATAGEVITIIKATDEDRGKLGEIEYFIDEEQSRFLINNSTGEITLNTDDLDFETTQSYLITIRAQDGGNAASTSRLTISVEDVNDESPNFDGNPYVLEIYEGSTVPERVLHVQATDGDEPNTERSRVGYSINRVISTSVDQDSFHLNETTGELSVKSPLDYESLLSSYGELLIEVVATDFGQPPRSVASNVTVRVLDKNDVTANFSKDLYPASVRENSLPGEFVTAVEALDNDGTKPNNEVYYVIDSGGQDKFQMNSTSGELVVGVGADLDRESSGKFTLTILAIDKGYPPKTGTATVEVTIEDVNDASPVFSEIQDSLYVSEDAKIGHTVVQLNATDKDSDHDLKFSLLWEESKAFDEKDKAKEIGLVQNWFTINATTGLLTVSTELDRELVQQVILKALVNDTASVEKVPQTDTVTMDIRIEDVNDNPPVIAACEDGLQLHVSEATQTETEITTFSATDRDKEQTISFSLNYDSYFNISSVGKLRLSRPLDRERQSAVNFTVVASDSVSPVQTSKCDVVVIVDDTNDSDPKFTTDATDFCVSESAEKGTVVGQINATDEDEGGKGEVTFDFKDSFNAAFAISEYQGEITVKAQLDREAFPSYSLTVIARDNPENPVLEQQRAATKLIHIHVTDENDNAPEFDTGGHDSFSGKLSEKKKRDDPVSISPKEISAIDKDTGINAEVKFSWKDPPNSYFRMEPSTGRVFVNRENLHGLAGKYTYTVVATDQGEPPLNATVTLTIEVLDENINSPKFVKNGPIPAIPECIKPETIIYSFTATDDDKNKLTNGKVIYSLDMDTATEDWKFFSIDQNTGDLKTRKIFDRETNDQLQIQVKAQDLGEPALTNLSGLLTISVSDINDNPPNFEHLKNEEIYFSVPEGSHAIGTIIGTVEAQDEDSNATLTYELTDNPLVDYFSVEADSDSRGILKLRKELDRETVETINLRVVAVDTSSLSAGAVCGNDSQPGTDHNLKSKPLPVKIFVEDVDDNPPVFVERSISQGFLSSTDFGTEIVRLPDYVNDLDTKKNSFHTFYQQGELVPSSEILKGWSKKEKPDPIRVDVNGSVLTNFKFPENILGHFQLKVKANDSAGSDVLDLRIFVVGTRQVVYLTFYLSENDMRVQKLQITELLSGALSFDIIPDNVLPFYNTDGSVDGSKSVLAVHALDKSSGSVIPGDVLLNKMDTSSTVNQYLQNYKILSTETAESARTSVEEDDGRMQYILAAVIVLMAFAFVITLIVLLNNIQRFKRKLKAATLEVHAMSVVEPDQFPGLNYKIKSSNPVFMRDDISLDDLGDNVSQHSKFSGNSENSLDQNEVDMTDGNRHIQPQTNSMESEEQEMTLDLYDRGQLTGHPKQQHPHHGDIPHSYHRQSNADIPQALQFLNAALEGEEEDDVNKVGTYNNIKNNNQALPSSRTSERGRTGDSGQNNFSFGNYVESTEI